MPKPDTPLKRTDTLVVFGPLDAQEASTCNSDVPSNSSHENAQLLSMHVGFHAQLARNSTGAIL